MPTYDELKAESVDLRRTFDLVVLQKEDLRNHLSKFMSLFEQVTRMHHNLEASTKEFESILLSIEELDRARKAHLEIISKQFDGAGNHHYAPPILKEQ